MLNKSRINDIIKKAMPFVAITILPPTFTFGTLQLISKCNVYGTMSFSSIQAIKPVDDAGQKEKEKQTEKSVDYSKLTWQEAIESVQTPKQAQDYLNNFFCYDFNKTISGGIYIPGVINTTNNKGESFKYSHQKRKGVCFDYAIAAAALLSDDNYPPLLLRMAGENRDHTVFLYKTENGYGALGNSSMPSNHPSVDDLVKGFKSKYNFSFDKYIVVNLDENYKNKEWISGDMDLHKNFPCP